MQKSHEEDERSKRWVDTDSTRAVPIDLVANVEEVVEDMEYESSNED